MKTLHKRGGVASEPALNTYKKLVNRLLSRSVEEENSEHTATISLLRDVLYKLASQYRSLPQQLDKRLNADFLEMLMATHYQSIMYSARSYGLKDISAKCSITLLKYPELIPHDKAFYQAGMACKDQGNINLSFLLLNRYI